MGKPTQSELRKIKPRVLRAVLEEDEKGTSYSEITKIVSELARIKPRAAKQWISEARKQGPYGVAADPISAIHRGNFAEARWEEVSRLADRAQIYRQLADDQRPDGKYYQSERLAVMYAQELSKLVHWQQLPPERLMSQPDVREQALVAIEQALQYWTEYELRAHIRACIAERDRRDELRAQGNRTDSEESMRQSQQDKVTAVS